MDRKVRTDTFKLESNHSRPPESFMHRENYNNPPYGSNKFNLGIFSFQ